MDTKKTPEGAEKHVKPRVSKLRVTARVGGAILAGATAIGAREMLGSKSVEAGDLPWVQGWSMNWDDSDEFTVVKDCIPGQEFSASGTISVEPKGAKLTVEKAWKVDGDPDPAYGNPTYSSSEEVSDAEGHVRVTVTGKSDPKLDQGNLHLGVNVLDEDGNPIHDGKGYDVNWECKIPTPDATSTSTEQPTATRGPTETRRARSTETPTPTPFKVTNTFTPNPTDTATPFPTPTDTEVPTQTLTPSPTPPGKWESPTPSNTPEASITPTPSDTPVPSDTPTAVNTPARETQPATQSATSTVGPTRTPQVVSTAVHELAAGGSQKVEINENVVKGGFVASVAALTGALALWLRRQRKK